MYTFRRISSSKNSHDETYISELVLLCPCNLYLLPSDEMVTLEDIMKAHEKYNNDPEDVFLGLAILVEEGLVELNYES